MIIVRKVLRTALFALAVFFCGCSDYSENWQIISAEGIWEEREHRVAMEFIDRNVGLLGATRMTEGFFDDFFMIGDAVIYRSKDGGSIWSVSLEIAGGVRGLCIGAEHAYALVNVRNEDYPHPLSEIWTSNDHGKSWVKTYTTEWPWYIIKLVADDSRGLTAIFRELKSDGGGAISEWVLKSGDSGQTWTQVTELAHIANYEKVLLHHGKLFLFVHVNGTLLSRIDLKTGISSILKHLGRFRVAVMDTDQKGGIRIVDQSARHEQLRLMTLDEDGKLVDMCILTDVKPAIPDSLHVSKESMFLVTGGHGSILGVTHHFYHSFDNGMSWKEEKLPFPLMVELAAYVGGNYAWLDAGGGWLQRRGFRSE